MIADLEAIDFEPLPDMVPLTSGSSRAAAWTTPSR